MGVVLVRSAEEMMWESSKGHDRTVCVGCGCNLCSEFGRRGCCDSLARCLRAGWRLFASSCVVGCGVFRLHCVLRVRCGEHREAGDAEGTALQTKCGASGR